MPYKQPISVDIFEEFGDDRICRDLFILLHLKSQVNDMKKPEKIGRRFWLLKRGEVVFYNEYYARMVGVSHGGINNALKRLVKVYAKVETKSSPQGTLVSLIDYDALCKMETKLTTRWKRNGDEMDEPKKDKIEKKEESIPIPLIEDHREYALSIGLTAGDIQRFEDYFGEKKPWRKGTFDVKARLRTWMSNAEAKFGHSKEVKEFKFEWGKTYGERCEQSQLSTKHKENFKLRFPKEYSQFYE